VISIVHPYAYLQAFVRVLGFQVLQHDGDSFDFKQHAALREAGIRHQRDRSECVPDGSLFLLPIQVEREIVFRRSPSLPRLDPSYRSVARQSLVLRFRQRDDGKPSLADQGRIRE
jgi:hypothetical protein